MNDIQQKLYDLKSYFLDCGKVAVAYSGGVDSTFLLWTAYEVLKDQAIAITAKPASFPEWELKESIYFTKENRIQHIIVEFDEFLIEGFAENPENRCYLCKKALFLKLISAANKAGTTCIIDGSNLDDEGDYRPGLQAIAELRIDSPLRRLKFTKEDIRKLSKEAGLPTWQKPSFACLATRFVYGETITKEKLKMTEKAEQFLREQGFTQIRVRVHGNLARIELLPLEADRIITPELRRLVHDQLKEFGFQYVTLDLQGYRTGSMNEGVTSF